MNIYEKLQFIQTNLKAPKSQRNDFGKYNFRNCEDILEAVKPHLAETKTALTLTDDLVVIGDRYYVRATATLIDAESSEPYCNKTIHNTAYAREEESKKGMDGSQVTGASSSYARKYALNGLFAIDDTKDSDSTNNGDTAEKQPKNQKKSQEPKKEKEPLDKYLLEEAERLNIELSNVAAFFNKPVEELTNDELAQCIERKAKAKAKTEVKTNE